MGGCLSSVDRTDRQGTRDAATRHVSAPSLPNADAHRALIPVHFSPSEAWSQTAYTPSSPTNYPIGGFSRPIVADDSGASARGNVFSGQRDDAKVSSGSGALGNAPGSATLTEKDSVAAAVKIITELCEEVRKVRYLGSGASGHVFKGEWLGAPVAVKYMLSKVGEESSINDAANEAILGRYLSHPNVVPTYSAKVVPITKVFLSELARLAAAERALGKGVPSWFTKAPPDILDADAGPSMWAGPDGPPEHLMGREFTEDEFNMGLIAPALPAPPPPLTHLSGIHGKNVQEDGEDGEDDEDDASVESVEEPPSVMGLQEVLHRVNAQPGDTLTQIVMEYCELGCLQHAIKQGVFLSTSRWGPRIAMRAMLRTARDLAQGMYHMHQTEVIHGDLKPGNVLIRGDRADRRGYIVKVADFGLSRVCSHTIQDDNSWATVHYMGPEAFEGVVTSKGDVYAFGVCLWQMVTGEVPHKHLNAAQIMYGVSEKELILEWPAETLPRVKQLGEACLHFTYQLRPEFEYIMEELSIIESEFRMSISNVGSSPTASTNGQAATAVSSPSPSPPPTRSSPQACLPIAPGTPGPPTIQQTPPHPSLISEASHPTIGPSSLKDGSVAQRPLFSQSPEQAQPPQDSPAPLKTSATGSSPSPPTDHPLASVHAGAPEQPTESNGVMSDVPVFQKAWRQVVTLKQHSAENAGPLAEKNGKSDMVVIEVSLESLLKEPLPAKGPQVISPNTPASPFSPAAMSPYQEQTSVRSALKDGQSADRVILVEVDRHLGGGSYIKATLKDSHDPNPSQIRESGSSLSSSIPNGAQGSIHSAHPGSSQKTATSSKGVFDLNPSYNHFASLMSLSPSPSSGCVWAPTSQAE